MKKRLYLSLVGLLALTALSACGEQGPQGERGSDGTNGLNGSDGKDGADGSKILTGNGEPASSSGVTGDLYIDVDTGDMYSKGESGWVKTGNIKGEKGDKGDSGENGLNGADGANGKDGVSITSVVKTSTDGNADTYTITYSDGSTSTFIVTNGSDGQPGAQGKKGEDGHTPTVTIGANGNWYVDGQDTGQEAKGPQGDAGKDGRSVLSIEKTSSDGDVDTYTITYSDGTTSTFKVTNGSDGSQGIQGEKGDAGHTPKVTIGANGNWYVDGVDSGFPAKGEKGDKGETGISVTKAYIDDNGDLICEMSDGSKVNAGHVKDVTKHTVRFYLDGEVIDTIEAADGSKISAPGEEKTAGYVINSWRVAEGNWSCQWSFLGNTVTSDLDLYADFEYQTYPVKLVSPDGSEIYETTVAYKTAYDFSTFYDNEIDHFENETGGSFAVASDWGLTCGETLTPVFGEQGITYKYYYLSNSSKMKEGKAGFSKQSEVQGVTNPNLTSFSGKRPADLDSPLEDASKEGYRFEGWYRVGDFYTSVSSCSYYYVTPLTTIHDAYFGTEICGFFSKYQSLSVTSNNDNAGKAEFVGEEISSACYGDEISVKATPNSNYTFLGWYAGDTLVSTDESYSFTMPGKDYSLIAKWEATTYQVSYDLSGGINDSGNPSTYTVENDEILLREPTKEGYEFKGWYADPSYSTRVTSIPRGSAGDRELYAKWEAVKHSLTVTSNVESGGSATKISGDGFTDETMSVKATPAEGYVFKGWYVDGECVSEDSLYIFTMPAKDYALSAVFWTNDQHLGISPFINSVKGTLTYGLYPQKHVSDSATLASLNALASAEGNGWYLLNGEYYAKKEANPYGSSYAFDDGETIVSGTAYWFKCEPITWKILSSEGGEYSLVSTVLLDAHRYNDHWYEENSDGYYANNYENSEIRSWLNKDFYNSAFSLGNSLIQTTTVDNSASTTNLSTNSYACSNTEDNVYLLSYKDYENSAYFADSTARQCKTTDWARANGAWYSVSSSYQFNGWYWTRSPSSSYSYGAWFVYYGGDRDNRNVNYSFVSVRPGLRIKVA